MESGFTWQSYPPEKLLIERFHITTGFHAGQRDIIEQLVEGKRIWLFNGQDGVSRSVTRWQVFIIHISLSSSPLSRR
jgi:hypothetical protein